MEFGGGDKLNTRGRKSKKSNEVNNLVVKEDDNKTTHEGTPQFKVENNPENLEEDESNLQNSELEEEMEISPVVVQPVEEDFCAGVIKRNLAALKIQTRFRGWLVRSNMKILTKCAIKIQGLWRGALVRMRRKRRLEVERARALQQQQQAKRVTHKSPKKSRHRKSPNAVPRGRSGQDGPAEGGPSQGKTLDSSDASGRDQKSGGLFGFGEFAGSGLDSLDQGQASSDSLTPSVEDGNTELRIRMERVLQCLETILKDYCGEDLSSISKTRVTELIEFMDANPDATKRDICLANSLTRLCPRPVSSEELGDQMVKVDPDKVIVLKDAIRLLRQRIGEWESQKLYRYHHLARTQAIPGVFSDPFSGELTALEEQLAQLRFNKGKDAGDSYISPAKFKTDNTAQLKELLTCDPEETKTLEKIYNFKLNYFPTDCGEIGVDVGKDLNGRQRQKCPPPFTTLFKANPKGRRQ